MWCIFFKHPQNITSTEIGPTKNVYKNVASDCVLQKHVFISPKSCESSEKFLILLVEMWDVCGIEIHHRNPEIDQH